MKYLQTTTRQFLRDERGLESVEYAVMTALIVGALATALGTLAVSIGNQMDDTRIVIFG